MKLLRTALLAAACLAGCADRPVLYLELGTPRAQDLQDCVPGSVSRPCQ